MEVLPKQVSDTTKQVFQYSWLINPSLYDVNKKYEDGTRVHSSRIPEAGNTITFLNYYHNTRPKALGHKLTGYLAHQSSVKQRLRIDE